MQDVQRHGHFGDGRGDIGNDQRDIRRAAVGYRPHGVVAEGNRGHGRAAAQSKRDGEGVVSGGGDGQLQIDVLATREIRRRAQLERHAVRAPAKGRDVRVRREGTQHRQARSKTGKGSRDAGHGEGGAIGNDDAGQVALVRLKRGVAIAGADHGAERSQRRIRQCEHDVVAVAASITDPKVQVVSDQERTFGQRGKCSNNRVRAVVVQDDELVARRGRIEDREARDDVERRAAEIVSAAHVQLIVPAARLRAVQFHRELRACAAEIDVAAGEDARAGAGGDHPAIDILDRADRASPAQNGET